MSAKSRRATALSPIANGSGATRRFMGGIRTTSVEAIGPKAERISPRECSDTVTMWSMSPFAKRRR